MLEVGSIKGRLKKVKAVNEKWQVRRYEVRDLRTIDRGAASRAGKVVKKRFLQRSALEWPVFLRLPEGREMPGH